MTPAKPETTTNQLISIKTPDGHSLSLAEILPSLNYKNVLELISQLKSGKQKIVNPKPFCILNRPACSNLLINYLRSKPQLLSEIQSKLSLKSPELVFKNISKPMYLTVLQNIVLRLWQQEMPAEIKTEIKGAVVPTSHLPEWQAELSRWQEQIKAIEEQHKQTAAKLGLPEFKDLDVQIKYIQTWQENLKKTAEQTLKPNLKYLDPEDQSRAINSLSQHVLRDIINEAGIIEQEKGIEVEKQITNGAIAVGQKDQEIQKQTEAEFQTRINSNFIAHSLENFYNKNPYLDMAVETNVHLRLIQNLAKTTKQTQLVQPQKLTKAQQQIQLARVIFAPTRQILKQSFLQKYQQYGLSAYQVEMIVAQIEIGLNHPAPTHAEVQNLLETSLINSLSRQTIRNLRQNNISLAQISDDFTPVITSYCQQQTLTLAQPGLGIHYGISLEAQKWSRKLNKKGVKVEPKTIENLLRGITPEKVEAEILRLQKTGIFIAPFTRIKHTLFYLKQNLEEIEKLYQGGNLPLRLRWKINRARIKLSILEGLQKVNPLSLQFYKLHAPSVFSFFDPKLKLAQKQWNFLRHESRLRYLLTPISKILTPFKSLNELEMLWYKKRWEAWFKIAQKISTSSPWRGFIGRVGKKARWTNRLFSLPSRLMPSFWLRPVYWSRRALGRSFFWVGKKLGSQTLIRLGAKIHKYTLKQLIKKGLTSLIGGPAGLIITAVAFIWEGIKFLTNPHRREALKEVVKTGAKAAAGLGLGAVKFITSLIAKFPLTFALGSVGLAVMGPTGAFLFGGAGFIADSALSLFGGHGAAAAAVGKAGVATASFLPNLAGSLGIIQTLSTTALISIGSTIGLTTLGACFIFLSTSSAFIAPPPEVPISPESQYLLIEKRADPPRARAGTIINYTITITSGADRLENLRVIDNIDQGLLENIQVEAPGVLNLNNPGGEIEWNNFKPMNKGTRVVLSYSAVTKNNVNQNTKTTNYVTATATIFGSATDAGGETITRTASFTLNSDGQEIAQRAKQISEKLQRGFWDFFNYSPEYQELFNWTEFNLYPNHCYLSNNYPENCGGDPNAIASGNSMFWCTWMVVKSYQETGHSVPIQLGVKGMYNNWSGQVLPANTAVSQLEPGDVIFFQKRDQKGNLYWAHVAIICEITSNNIYTCESNNFCKYCSDPNHKCNGWVPCFYNIVNAQVQGSKNLIIGAFGKP